MSIYKKPPYVAVFFKQEYYKQNEKEQQVEIMKLLVVTMQNKVAMQRGILNIK